MCPFSLFLPIVFIDEVIHVKKFLKIKVPALEFGGFVQFIGIWLLITSNPGMNQVDYFSDTPVDIFVLDKFL